jgi:hypothetical protein
VPKRVKGCEKPTKLAYDCEMGREFAQEELEEGSVALQATAANGTGSTLRVCVATIVGRAPNNGATTLIPARIPMEVLEEFVEHAQQEPENLAMT